MRDLTERQREVYDFIASFAAEHGYTPTFREIGDALGMKSPQGVAANLDALQKKGWITREPFEQRSIRLLGPCPDPDVRREGNLVMIGSQRLTVSQAERLLERLGAALESPEPATA